uniref:PvdE, pyoverdine ABC export system, fused ATPase and permease components n=1 Tax=Rheinheimera sp. BAL341 TaxID=1708203 RepID=A0A486XTY1_9GAMM
MKLFDVFVKESPNKVFIGLITGVITGVTFSFLIPLVLIALDYSGQELQEVASERKWLMLEVNNPVLAMVFFATCIFIIVLKTFSQSLMASVALNAASNLRLNIYRRINSAPIAQIESLGQSKLVSIVTGDIPRIIAGVSAIPDLMISLMSVFGVLAFMAFISFQTFLFILATIVFGLVTYQVPLMIGQRYYAKARPLYDKLHESIRGIIFGAKELKLNEEKREAFYKEDLESLELEIRKKEKTGFILMQGANNYGDLISFLVVGVVTFIISNYIKLSNAQLVGVVMALIYMISPIHAILQCLPLISVGNVSLGRLNWLLDNLHEEVLQSTRVKAPEWQKIYLKNVCYDYSHGAEGKEKFQLGPVNLTLSKGEVTYIVGGNGSGKSTMSKMITQHYLPSAGTIYFDNVPVDEANRASYRHTITSIYSDYYLFNRILGHKDSDVDTIVSDYLVELGLAEKVTVQNGHFSTILLSDGQKRRLALLVALLENRDLYVFDEWAADQDPSFKDTFYNHYLPLLRNQGKAVVVITHDDRYFDLADKIIWMESGNVSRTTTPGVLGTDIYHFKDEKAGTT